MLESLYVKDFAIVGETEIAFDAGMTVVTGETGAGKSLLVDALLLLAGARAEAGMIRHGCERAEIAASFDLRARKDLVAWLVDEALDEDGACQLRRVIRSEGSSRAWINGRPVTLAQMKTLASGLIEIHGQHEHQALLGRSQQLALVDAFGDHAATLAEVATHARRWREVHAEIDQLSRGLDHSERIDWLAHQVDELDRHALAPEDLDALEHLHRQLSNAGELLQGCAALAERFDGDSDLALLRGLSRAEASVAQLTQLDPRLAPIGDLVSAAQIQLVEASDALARYQDVLDLDPERLAEADAKLGKLHELARKHRVRIAGLGTHAQELRVELESLRGAGERIDVLRGEDERVRADYARAAAALTTQRVASSNQLGKAVSELMGELGMHGGVFEVALEPRDDADPDPLGAERCEFLVSANPGQPPRALRKVASGGELSRISLAIEVAALGGDDVGTMVFDEVDAGIGGAVAEVVGHKLRALGAHCQVLCVTHLPQVAAQGNAHLRVEKALEGDETRTRIEHLDARARRDEIARMLGGVEITRETLAHARRMLADADRDS